MSEPQSVAEALQQAVEGVYAAFAHHRLPAAIEYCDHCVGAEENEILMTVPLRQLSSEQLRRYAWKAMTTWGGDADFRHFLPRILEHLVAGEVWDTDGAIRKAANYGRGWPPEEWAAIDRLLGAWWAATLAAFPAPVSAPRVLEVLAERGGDPWRYLTLWNDRADESSVRHLADTIGDHAQSMEPDDEWSRRVREWITSGVPTRILEAATLNATDPVVAAEYSQAHEYASWYESR
ncbi:hypothetical protein AB0M47_01685 [Hamadaea sp. NPDC051192]|uniref:hypothetical protein n=1 Tax=Hamadaea sp. NPDC051192 TaxID=3154940 RepID=UPI00342D7E02